MEPLKKNLKCNLCEFECDLQDNFESHLVCHYPKYIYVNDMSETLSIQSNLKCKLCNNKFDNDNELNRHIIQCHIETLSIQSKLKCKLCDNKFDNDNELNRHINECHIRNAGNQIPVLTQSHRCKDLNVLNGKKIKQYNCHDCDHEGTSSKELKKHVNSSCHKNHDDLSKKCFSCNLVCLNFDGS